MAAESKVVACIPAHNEEKSIGGVVLRSRRHADVVLVCDDGSTDLTGEIAAGLGATVIRHDHNLGKGAALRSLFSKAFELGAEVVVTIDGDGQFDPDEIPKLVAPVKRGEADVVIGSRFIGGGDGVPFLRRVGNRVLTSFTSSVPRARQGGLATDSQSGFRAYAGRALGELRVEEEGMGVDSQLLVQAYERGLRVREELVKVSYVGIRRSRNPVLQMLDVSRSLIWMATRRRPLLYFSLSGVVLMVVGAALGARVLAIFVETNLIATGTALLTVVFLVMGFLAFLTGVILYAIREALERNGRADRE